MDVTTEASVAVNSTQSQMREDPRGAQHQGSHHTPSHAPPPAAPVQYPALMGVISSVAVVTLAFTVMMLRFMR